MFRGMKEKTKRIRAIKTGPEAGRAGEVSELINTGFEGMNILFVLAVIGPFENR